MDEDTGVDSEPEYIVFKREDFYQMMGGLALPPWTNPSTGKEVGGDWNCAPIAGEVVDKVEATELRNVVLCHIGDPEPEPTQEEVRAQLEKLLSTTDASVWAKEFCKIFVVHKRGNTVDIENDNFGLMVGWFANAIVTAEQIQLARNTSSIMEEE